MELSDWMALLEDEPDNELVRFTVAKHLMDAQKWPEARIHFEKLVQNKADYALAWAFLARCLMSEGLKDEAREVCEKALPIARAQKHEIPLGELEAVMAELDSEF
jgi:tetratricopeptide (TPR) repeat protein